MTLCPMAEDGTLPLTVKEAKEFRISSLSIPVLQRLSREPGAGCQAHQNTHSGHYIHQEQPQLVIDSVRGVLYVVEAGLRRGGGGRCPP